MGLRSMFSGISGLQSHSTWLDVIGNNISNTNTIAYKASRVEFADQISQTLYGGTGDNPGSNLGGVNPQQVGLGTRVASIQTIFTEGVIQNTGNSTDIALVGDGFLVSKSGNSTLLTRAGNLSFDGLGNLVDQNGGLIQGFNAHVQYTQIPLHAGPPAAAPLVITDASLKLDNTNISQITNINIKRDFVLPPKATTQINFSGNLDSFQQANQRGGILDLNPGGVAPQLPFVVPNALNGASATLVALAPYGAVIQQQDNFSDPANASTEVYIDPIAGKQLTTGAIIDTGVIALTAAQAIVTNAWEQQPPVPPAHVMSSTVYDSLGNARSVTIQLYQVNDLGTAVPPVNTPPMNQVLYAWYAFDTTGGALVSNATLIGGTAIAEGDPTAPAPGAALLGYDRGVANDSYVGDFIWFNTDGSLASLGGELVQGGVASAARPAIYLPPVQDDINLAGAPASPLPNIGAEITRIYLDFGQAGLLGAPGVANPGLRNGLYSDAEGSYQVINGVNTYVPNHTGFAKTQDGYTDGQLTGVSFDKLGNIVGSFTNDQHVALAQVVMAMPNNQGGLNKAGSNYYSQSANSGPLFVGTAGQMGLGFIQGSSLELSNVDLTVELSNMIIAQRGFEVNARVISVTNSTLQTTVQLGQGG